MADLAVLEGRLAALDDRIAGLAATGVKSKQIGDRKIENFDLSDLQKMRAALLGQIQQLRGKQRNILLRFK